MPSAPEVLHVFYGIHKTKKTVEKYELRRDNDLLRVAADGEPILFRLGPKAGPVGFLKSERHLIAIDGAPPTEPERLAKIRADLEAKAQAMRAK